jgi:DNA-binding NarL/FixJ family response regulator
LVVGSGARGAEAIRRIREIRPGLPALLAALDAEVPALLETFSADPVIVLREPAGQQLAQATRALLQAAERSSSAPAETLPPRSVPEIEPRSYAHLAGLLPRALERTVAFDVGAAVIARPGGEPLVDVFARADCPEATLELVRARALALYRQVAGGAQAGSEAADTAAASTLRSSMYFPLATEGAVVGLTYLAAFQPGAFSPADEQVLADLARHASGAYRRLEASVHRLRLSPRQSQVLALIASGLSDKEVASRLGLAHRTVRTHVDRMLREHGLRSRTEAVAAWLRGREE